MSTVTLLRKPLNGGGILSVLPCGSLNIDDSRIASDGGHMVQTKESVRRMTLPGDTREGKALGMYRPGATYTPTNHAGGRYPANLILCHLSGCVQAGTRQARRSLANGKNLLNEREVYQKGLGSESTISAIETIDSWSCAPGCPVAGIDVQSGLRPGMSGGGATEGNLSKRTGAEILPYNRKVSAPFIRSDTGGASRFFKNVK